jgi:hypothetical protein
MNAFRNPAARVLAVAVIAPCVAAAQGPVARDCEATIVDGLDLGSVSTQWQARLPRNAYEGMRDRISRDQWIELADSVVLDFDDAAVSVPEGARQAFITNLRRTRDEIAFVERQPNAVSLRRTARIVRQDRFRIERSTNPNTPDVYHLFRGTPDSTVIDAGMDSLARRALCWRALSVRRMLTAYGALARQEAVKALHEAARNWDNYGERGYSQYPWELAINGLWFDAASINPPRWQLIVAHPALSLEFRTRDLHLDELVRSNTVTLEPIGFIRYSSTFVNYVGVSALLSLPSEERVGAGVLAHIGTYGKIGYVFWRSRDETGRRDPALIISADLYQFLAAMPTRLRSEKERALRLVRGRMVQP